MSRGIFWSYSWQQNLGLRSSSIWTLWWNIPCLRPHHRLRIWDESLRLEQHFVKRTIQLIVKPEAIASWYWLLRLYTTLGPKMQLSSRSNNTTRKTPKRAEVMRLRQREKRKDRKALRPLPNCCLHCEITRWLMDKRLYLAEVWRRNSTIPKDKTRSLKIE